MRVALRNAKHVFIAGGVGQPSAVTNYQEKDDHEEGEEHTQSAQNEEQLSCKDNFTLSLDSLSLTVLVPSLRGREPVSKSHTRREHVLVALGTLPYRTFLMWTFGRSTVVRTTSLKAP